MLPSADAMAGQYIEPMLATRWPGVPLAAEWTLASRLPSPCAVCRGWGWRGVCHRCLDRFAPPAARCRCCALSVAAGTEVCGGCLVNPPPFDAALACFDDRPPWDRLITAFKFHDSLELAPFFAAALAAEAGRGPAAPPDLVLPVPLAAARLRERGYNQAAIPARRAARLLGIATEGQLLLRVRETAHQLELPADSRAGNVRGAFAVEPRRRGEMAGRHVAVVDDVMTTGSAVAEIARVLKHAGAARVDVGVVARTPRPQDA
jgi:ComF family protein